MKKSLIGKVNLQEGTDTSALYGSYDRHIKMIEQAFNVRMTARGEEVTIEGEPEQVQQVEKVIADLANLSRDGFRVTAEDVNYAIQSSQQNAPASVREIYQDAIPVFGKKKLIAPKSPSQKEYIESIRKHDIVVGIGPAGTGKTYLAMAMAVSSFLKKEVNRIILARPAVEAGEKLGFLPGDLVEKVNPYLRPLYDALYDMMEVDRATRLLERGDIEIAPLAFMRGRTLNDSFIILDEAQNATSEQMKMFLTRLGFRSKAVVTGDITQVDLPVERTSGLIEIQGILEEVSAIKFVYFSERDVIRHRLVQEIVKAYERYEGKGGKSKKK
ncbi:PhoH family protein [Candidatus Manganitrophus noduliformans]|nr:PhoH family protein [Candidatus Manganitrophus noduliformans]